MAFSQAVSCLLTSYSMDMWLNLDVFPRFLHTLCNMTVTLLETGVEAVKMLTTVRDLPDAAVEYFETQQTWTAECLNHLLDAWVCIVEDELVRSPAGQ